MLPGGDQLLSAAGAPAADTRPRLIVLTDIGGEPDDTQSMIRLLAYANEFRIVGLIATQDQTLSDGSPNSHVRQDFIQDLVDDYAVVLGNLTNHADGYPTAGDLSALIKNGANAADANPGAGKATSGSNHIVSTVDSSSEITWVTIWGGQTDLAQAIWQAENGGVSNFSAWLAKLRVYAITDQDSGLSAMIRGAWPTLFYIENGPVSTSSADRAFRGMYQNDSADGTQMMPTAQLSLVFTPWVTSNVHGHGVLGAGYPTNIDQVPTAAANNHSVAEGGGVKEGDTPSWFYLLPNGLGNRDEPSWGGWGGRFDLVGGTTAYYVDALDETTDPPLNGTNTAVRRKWPIARWRQEYQNDFAARMDWCNTATFANANHHPVALLNGDATKAPVAIAVNGGDTVNLSAAGSIDSDPTPSTIAGTALSYSWSHYKGVGGSYTGTISITGATSQACSFTAPNINGTIHIILKVTDNGTPNLTSYRRAVITVTAVVSGFTPVTTTEVEFGTGAATWDMTVDFTNVDYLTLRFASENATLSSVVIDPAGANLAMTQVVAAANGVTQCWAYYRALAGAGLTGSKTVRITWAAAKTGNCVWRTYAGAAQAAPTPTDTDNNTPVTTLSNSLAAPNPAGSLEWVGTSNIITAHTLLGGLIQDGAMLVSTAETCSISQGHIDGGLANPAIPGFSYSGTASRMACCAYVVNPA